MAASVFTRRPAAHAVRLARATTAAPRVANTPSANARAEVRADGRGCPRYLAGCAASGAGHAIDSRSSARLAAGFGRPVSHLRLHTDAHAAALSQALDAQAVTAGSHIFFAADRSPADLGLLAHEAAHALQQPARLPRGPLPLAAPGSAQERSADAAASSILAGGQAATGPSAPAQLARKPRGVLEWAWDKAQDPQTFIDEVVEHPFDATVGGAGEAFVGGVKQDVDDVGDLGADALHEMRATAQAIRGGGDAVETWLVNNQKKVAAAGEADAAEHVDTPVLGSLLKANAWLADQSGQFSTGVVNGAVSLGSGLLAGSANPVDTGLGALKLGAELVNLSNPLFYASSAGSNYVATGDASAFNPLARGTALGAAWENLSKPYARAISKDRWSEAGGRLFFDAVSMLVGGGEANAASKGSRLAPKVRLGAGVDSFAKTALAGDRLVRALPAADDLSRTANAGSDLANTLPSRPMPTQLLPGTPMVSAKAGSQLLKWFDWMDAFYRPQTMRPASSRPVPVAAGDVAAAAHARSPIVPHLSEAFHRNIWEAIGGKGEPPLAFRHNDVLFVDYQRLPVAVRDAVDAGRSAHSQGNW